ncbi:MAG: hypothetical protein Q6373_011015 [Candidatus Sigynarchaeota archaeon]
MNDVQDGTDLPALAGKGDDEETRSLAGKSLLDALHAELDDVDFSGMRFVQVKTGVASFKYVWCEPINRFLDFLERRLKLSVGTSYHDAIKYLIFRVELGGQGRLEACIGGRRFDLVDIYGKKHEVKTRELKNHGELAMVIRRFVRLVKGDDAGRDVWWLSFLRACKGIKARPCSFFLGLLQLPARVARAATRKADIDVLVKELVEMADHAESKLLDDEDIDEDELEEGFLFGVENKVTRELRKDVLAKITENKRLKSALQQKEAELKQKEAELKQKEAELKQKEAENQHLKREIDRLKGN